MRMSDAAVRVALLGRAGKARDQLHRALTESGAAIVAEGDPGELDPATVAGLSPTCYLVSLEPAIERSLERFDELLAAPGVEVMFDDAETSAGLDGWDLNRWARHIASKLLGHDGLPPAPEGSLYGYEDAPPAPGRADVDSSLDFDLGDDGATDASPGVGMLRFAEADDGADDLSDSIDFSSGGDDVVEGGELDLDVAELTAQLEAYETSGKRMPSLDSLAGLDGSFNIESIDSIDVKDTAASAAAQAKPDFDFSNMALAPMDAAATATAAVPGYVVRADALDLSLDPLPGEVAVPAAAATPASAATAAGPTGAGAVVILAGLGGPDAVRQLLSSLPETLHVPVLLYQHLEVGKHERLVDQLAKISRLPVQLARDGLSPERGRVSLLPAGMTATAQGNALVFHAGALSQLIAALPPADSMIIVLSGADPQLVPMILEMGEAGGTVLAQDPDVCFDAGAAEAMQRQGAAVFPALGLARQIAARWTH